MKKIKKMLLLSGFCLSLFFVSGRTAFAAEEHRIPEGVEVEGIDLGGMTSEEAVTALNTYVDSVQGRTLHLMDGEESVDIPFAEFSVDIADASVIDALSKVGSGGNVLKRYKELTDVKNHHAVYKISFTCDSAALKNALTAREGEINREPQDASLVRHGGQLILTEGVHGRSLHVDETVTNVVNAITAADSSWDRTDLSVEMVVERTQPQHTTEELAVIDTEIGSYSTSFGGSSYNRIENIKNGAAKIDETILYPGETFSFTQMVAPFTLDNGYLVGTGYSAGKTVDSIGGGICQVSTTLYNAVLRAELTVVERLNHMMTVNYVPLGADATIAEPTIDFKFRNDYDTPIYIEAYTYNGYVTVAIYGKEHRPANRTIEFESVTDQVINPGADVVTEDPTQPVGYENVTQSAHTGYVASFYKLIYVDGVLESRELVNQSTYNAYPRHVTKGTKEPETEAPQTEAPQTEVPQTEAPLPPQTEAPPVVETPPTEAPPVVETPPTEAPPVVETPPTEAPPAVETPPTEAPQS